MLIRRQLQWQQSETEIKPSTYTKVLIANVPRCQVGVIQGSQEGAIAEVPICYAALANAS